MEATRQEKDIKDLQDERTLEILKSIKTPQTTSAEKLNQYCSRLEKIAQMHNCKSEELFDLAEGHQLSFETSAEVMTLSLSIQALKRSSS